MLAVDDGVDDRVECQVARAGERLLFLGVAQQHMEEFVAQQRLDMVLGGAVRRDKAGIDQQARPRLAGHRGRRHRGAQLRGRNAQQRANRERVLVDQFMHDPLQAGGIEFHA